MISPEIKITDNSTYTDIIEMLQNDYAALRVTTENSACFFQIQKDDNLQNNNIVIFSLNRQDINLTIVLNERLKKANITAHNLNDFTERFRSQSLEEIVKYFVKSNHYIDLKDNVLERTTSSVKNCALSTRKSQANAMRLTSENKHYFFQMQQSATGYDFMTCTPEQTLSRFLDANIYNTVLHVNKKIQIIIHDIDDKDNMDPIAIEDKDFLLPEMKKGLQKCLRNLHQLT